MENENNELAKALIDKMPNDLFIEKQRDELEAARLLKEAEKAREAKYSSVFALEVNGKDVKCLLKSKITPATRHEIRALVAEQPVHPVAKAVRSLKLQFPDDTDAEIYKKMALDALTEQQLERFMQGLPDNDYEEKAEIFVMRYFQLILSNTGDTKELIDTPVVVDGKLSSLWLTVDYGTVLEAVAFFRKKTGM